MYFVQIGSFLLFTLLVAVISYKKTKESRLDTSEGYYLGGRSLSGIVIAGSLLLTNLSSEQLIGTNGQAYVGGASIAAYELTSGITLVVLAVIFLPKYLRMGITTLPEYLEDRYDPGVRNLVTVLFLLGILLVTIPTVLYSGSLAFISLFDLENLTGLSTIALLYILCIGTAVIGSIYAIFGGLKAVAVSDTVNGIGLLAGGVLIPILGFIKLGDGSFFAGVNTLLTTQPDMINLVGSSDDPVPFGTIFTGILLTNLFYWCTNQAILQRTFGARSLEEGQKGALYAGILKVFVPIILVTPGLIAFSLYGGGLANGDLAYTTLVADVLPVPLVGVFAAVMFGAILSTFNSGLNSASTMYALNVHRPLINKSASDAELIKVGKRFGIIIAIVSVLLAPQIMNANGGLFQFMKKFMSFFNIPTLVVIGVGFATKKVPPIAAKVAIAFYMIAYGLITFVWKWDINFLYVVGILFVICIIIMLVIGKIAPQEPYEPKYVEPPVDMKTWKYTPIVSKFIITLTVYIYALFSPIGIAKEGAAIGFKTAEFSLIFIIVTILWCLPNIKKIKEEKHA